jgi:hypothetical protein
MCIDIFILITYWEFYIMEFLHSFLTVCLLGSNIFIIGVSLSTMDLHSVTPR